jgi:hypothetical protein
MDNGLVPNGQGWFVLNAQEAHWWKREGRCVLCEFEEIRARRRPYREGWLP